MFEALALGGGGVRGGLLVGGLSALEKLRGNLTFPGGIYGCSIGSILATIVAFNIPVSTLRIMFEEDFQLSRAIPPIRLSNVTGFQTTKGLFPMTLLRDTIASSFRKHGIELEGKLIGDAPQKLYILTSNLTTGRSTFLTGDVPLLDALLCSCCIPFVFEPQVVFQNVYVDGGVFVHYIHKVVPQNCLVFHVELSSNPIFPSNIKDISLNTMFSSIYFGAGRKPCPSNVVVFRNNTIQILQELTPEDRQMMYDAGYSMLTRFWSKRASQELK